MLAFFPTSGLSTFLCRTLAFAGFFAVANAETSGVEPFAPSEGWVKGPEREFRAEICLNGSWQFQPVALPKAWKDGSGVAPELARPTERWEQAPVKVPSPWNVNSFANEKDLGGDFRAYPSYPKAWEDVRMGWLRRQVDVPTDWKGKRIILQFDGVAGDAEIVVNGKSVGRRFDLFFPFQIDVTDAIKLGSSNEILVGIRKASLTDIKGGQYGRRIYQAGSFWGQHIVGIWQDVFLVALPKVRVTNVFVQPIVDQSLLKADVTVRNDGKEAASVDIRGLVKEWKSLSGSSEAEAPVPKWELTGRAALELPSSKVTVPAGTEKVVTVEQKVGQDVLKYWTPKSPSLYGLVVELTDGNGGLDRKYTRFGWRQFKIDGARLTLNGEPIELHGESWHFMGIPQMTRRYAWAWYKAVHEANGNAVRLHAQPYPEFYLEVADEMGIMILDETAIWASDGGPKLDDEKYWTDSVDHVAELVKRDRNHPSVFGWSICNEVRPVIKHVFHGPQEMMDTLVKYYRIWAETCRRLDPTRDWISADGDDDGEGTLPTYVIHYGDEGTMKRAKESGKPWGVGEASGAYYMTPEQSSKFNGERSYESFEGRMEGIAIESYEHLLMQRKHGGSYVSVFNLAWYALKPLPLGLKDTSRPPTLDDGIFFGAYREGVPGVQPERLGPYSTTLNPGYDRALPLYETWPLFTAIKNATATEPSSIPWQRSSGKPATAPAKAKPITTVAILSEGGSLRSQLETLGLPEDVLNENGTPQLLLIDGKNPPPATAKIEIQAVLAKGGTAVVLGLDATKLPQLNALLPQPVELTSRQGSSLLPQKDDPLVAGLTPSKLYFSELSPSEILAGGIGGPVLETSDVLLAASDTDWLLWNKRAEYAKTGMVHRSEQEKKESGAALIRFKEGKGQIVISNLPVASNLFKIQEVTRQLLANLGLTLGAPADMGGSLLRTGGLTRALVAGRFPAVENVTVDSAKVVEIKAGSSLTNKAWKTMDADQGVFHLSGPPVDGHAENVVVYVSFWVLSPRPLDNLLIEPNIPRVDFKIKTLDALEFSLNGKPLLTKTAGDSEAVAKGLPIQQGWNHFLLKLTHAKGLFEFSGALECSQPTFLSELNSAVEKP